jgi:hypothetical protein
MNEAVKAPVLIGEKTTQEIKNAEATRVQAETIAAQARNTIQSIAIALREAKGLPDTWMPAQMADGRLYLVDSAQAAGEAQVSIEAAEGRGTE